MRFSGDGCRVDLRAEGKIEFTPDFTDVSSISNDGFFRLDVTDGGVRRELEIQSRGGSLTRTWRVDGREASYDAAARAWFAAFLIELDRRTAVGVDIRLPALLRQGGPAAVLRETALMPSDYARSRYYTQLSRTTKLAPGDITQVLRQAAAMNTSDYYSAELVAALAGQGLDEQGRMATAQLIDRMESDYYRATSIDALVGSGRPGPQEMALLAQTLPRMTSDHYKLQVMTRMLSANRLEPAQLASLAKTAATITSDYYAAEFLKALAAQGPLTSQVREPFFEAAGHIRSGYYLAEALTSVLSDKGTSSADVDRILQMMPAVDSDHYRAEVLSKLARLPQLTERDLIAIAGATKVMRSDYDKTETLRSVAAHRAANDRVRQAVLDAAADAVASLQRGDPPRGWEITEQTNGAPGLQDRAKCAGLQTGASSFESPRSSSASRVPACCSRSATSSSNSC